MQPLARHHARMERLFAPSHRRFWCEGPGSVSWGLRIQRAGCGRRFCPPAPCAGTNCQGSRIRRIENVTMPGTTATPEIEIIVEDIGGGGGGLPPSFGGDDDGDGGGDDGDRRRSWSASPKRYSTAIAIGLVSILMFFMALASAF